MEEDGELPGEDASLTLVLRRMATRDGEVHEDAVAPIYRQLRSLVLRQMRHSPPGQTLQPTALLNELYLKLFGSKTEGWNDRSHFFKVAGVAIRTLLVDQARRRKAAKRRPPGQRLELEEIVEQFESHSGDILDLNATLERLEAVDSRLVRLIEFRFFVGLPAREIAEIEGISPRSVNRDLEFAKKWIARELRSRGF